MSKWNHHEGNDAFGRPYTKSPNHDKGKIIDYWYNGPLASLFHKKMEGDFCMVCGKKATTDRAHIFAQMYKGSHRKNNLHLLCKSCHLESEELESFEYWAWLMVKGKLYHRGFFTPFEIDYINKEEFEKKGKKDMYFMYGEAEYKVKEKSSLIAKHMMYKDGLTFSPTRAKIVHGALNASVPIKDIFLWFFLWMLPIEMHETGKSVFEDIYEIDEWLHMHILNAQEEEVEA